MASRPSPAAQLLALTLGAGLGVGLACGPASHETTLPRPGSDDDDGTGALARLSRRQWPRAHPAGTPVQTDYGDPYGGDPYGGGLYGGGGGISTHYPSPTSPPSPTDPSYGIITVVEPGAIAGVVTWKGPRPLAKLPAAAGAARCGGAQDNRTLELSSSNEVGHAVVYLADVRQGKAPPMALGGTVDAKGCALSPRVQVAAPIGLVAQIGNLDADATALRVNGPAGEADELALPARATREVTLGEAGAWRLGFADAHPGTSAWLFVPSTPYAVVTDEHGRFRIDDVPPGEYTLMVWHEPVATGVDQSGKLVQTPTAPIKQTVKVKAYDVTSVKLELKPGS